MSFFGLTMLGGTNGSVFARLNAHKLAFHEIDEEKYLEAFDKFSIAGTDLSATLKLSGEAAILRESLPDVLRETLGREPTPEEKHAFMSFMVFDNAAYITFGDFLKGVDMLKKRSLSEAKPEYVSNKKLLQDRHMHKRTEVDPQLVSIKPLTGNAEYGWTHQSSLHTFSQRTGYTLTTTDVTKKEGRSLADYYM